MANLIDTLLMASKDEKLSDSLKLRLSRYTRRTLLYVWRMARTRSRKRAAYFWRNLKVTTWRLLAGLEA